MDDFLNTKIFGVKWSRLLTNIQQTLYMVGWALLIGTVIGFILALLLFFFGRNLFSLFFSDPTVLDMGVLISKYIIVVVLFQISQIIFGGCLRGAGDMRYCLFASLISVTLIRSIVTWGLTSVFALGLHGIWIGILSDQVSRFLFLSLRFREGSWARIRI